MKKSGFTLMELMVYIAILGVVVIIAGQAFSNSTKIRVRTESMVKVNEEAGRIGAIIQDDIAQMGAKSSKERGATEYARDSFYVSDSVYMNVAANDFSSFTRVQKDANDSFAMRRMRYDEDGRFASVEEVSWFVVDGKLYRKCRALEVKGTESSDCPKSGNTVEIVDKVAKFLVVPAQPAVMAGASSRIFPSSDVADKDFRLIPRKQGDLVVPALKPEKGGAQVTLSNFASNYNVAEQKVDDTKKANQLYAAAGTDDAGFSETGWSTNCTRITLEPRTEYELYFKVPYVANNKSRSFCPGMDHMAVGFRNSADGSSVRGLSDFTFYPPIDLAADDERRFRIKTDSLKSDVCIAFTFSMFSPTAPGGAVTISHLSLSKVEDSEYEFDESFYPANVEDKQKVKAVKLILTINRNGESGVVSRVVSTPSNGKNK